MCPFCVTVLNYSGNHESHHPVLNKNKRGSSKRQGMVGETGASIERDSDLVFFGVSFGPKSPPMVRFYGVKG